MPKQLGPLRSVLRDKIPNVQNGSIGTDIVRMIQTFAHGMQLNVEKVKPSQGVADEPDYGQCFATIGRLGEKFSYFNFNSMVKCRKNIDF